MVKIKWAYILCFLLASFSDIQAQISLPSFHDSLFIQEQTIELYGLGEMSSNGLQRSVSDKFLFGGYIDSDTKNLGFASLSNSENILGVDLSFGAEYRNANIKVFKKHLGLLVRAKSSTYASFFYPKDVYGILLYGNQLYENDTARMGNTGFRQISFQKIGVGIFDKKTKTNASVNLYNITSLSDLYLPFADLYTAQKGDSLVLDLAGQYSSTNNPGFGAGLGLGVDFEYRIPVQWIKGQTAFFSANVQDLGVMYVPNRTAYFADTVLRINGFTLQELRSAQEVDRDQILDSLGVKKTSISTAQLLPTLFQFSKLIDDNNTNRFQSFFGVRMYTSMHYKPMFFFGQQWRINANMHWAVQTHYGGFSKWRFGSYFRARLNQADLALGTEDLVGLLMQQGFGRNLSLKLRYRW